MSEEKLEMTFDMQTIEHLGIKMYSRIPNALAELVANAYDADASEVIIKLYDNEGEKRIEIIDNGIGMGFDDINEKFLRIGRNRRSDDNKITPNGRKATGKKGLGKLALFGIGTTIDITTTQIESNEKVSFTLDWDVLTKGAGGKEYTEKSKYEPKFQRDECSTDEHGTTIILQNIKRSSDFKPKDLAVSLSKLFNFFDDKFKCCIILDDEEPIHINNELKYGSMDKEFDWSFPATLENIDKDYEHKDKISGEIIAATMVLKPEQRGIALFANGRLVNANEFFDAPETSHGFSYITGYLDVSFIDDMHDDLISTNRQSLSWDDKRLTKLRDYITAIIRYIANDIRKQRKDKKNKELKEKTQIDTEKWYERLPKYIRNDLEPIINIIDDSGLSTEKLIKVVEVLYKLIPELPLFHWRNLHPEIQQACKDDYERGDYYNAAREGMATYVGAVCLKSKAQSDNDIMNAVFGKPKNNNNSSNILPHKLSVTKKHASSANFLPSTLDDIQEGQRGLSSGIVSALRHPLAHNSTPKVKNSKLFTEKDCLDFLSLLSHLFRRLDNAEIV